MSTDQLNLYDALNSTYQDENKQESTMKKFGYNRDNSSNDDHQIYHKEGNLLFTIAGTHKKSDVVTDAMLGLGLIKHSKRYKQSDQALTDAKKKYNITDGNTTIIGHSLGGNVGNLISSKSDKVITYNSGYTLGSKTRSNNKAYRTKGDIVSVLGNNQINLKNKNLPIRGIIGNGLKAHTIENLRNEQIFI
jgi:hypothetical protein